MTCLSNIKKITISYYSTVNFRIIFKTLETLLSIYSLRPRGKLFAPSLIERVLSGIYETGDKEQIADKYKNLRLRIRTVDQLNFDSSRIKCDAILQSTHMRASTRYSATFSANKSASHKNIIAIRRYGSFCTKITRVVILGERYASRYDVLV